MSHVFPSGPNAGHLADPAPPPGATDRAGRARVPPDHAACAHRASRAGPALVCPPAIVRTRDLWRCLMLRIAMFGLLLTLAIDAAIVLQARDRARASIERAAPVVLQLVVDELARHDGRFHIGPTVPDLARLDGLGGLAHVCVSATDLWGRSLAERCIGAVTGQERAPRWLAGLIGALIGNGVEHRGPLLQPTGIKNGELVIRPDIESEAAGAWRTMLQAFWLAAALLVVKFMIRRPLRRALAPSAEILAAVEALERGRLDTTLPRYELMELDRIAAGFNHLAARLRETLAAQRELAARLLAVREEERRSLARELHDELGQALTSIRAEAAFAAEIARDELPALLPCADALVRTSAATMDSVQRIVRGLRPPELELGLAAALRALVDDHLLRARRHGGAPAAAPCIELADDLDALDDGVAVSLYRVAQECLTNVARHGGRCTALRLVRDADCLRLEVDDDGSGQERAPARDEATADPQPADAGYARAGRRGFGRLGMAERMAALGGSLDFEPLEPAGLRVRAALPTTVTPTDRLADPLPQSVSR
ncbi:histidine kinase [Derxia gummosa]|uniref:Histidine kinase n=1 Tax=Derxia gummosa DSM 723 TaxID=1121388 RepID=A0A8B6X834_9BURK|nr:histidine kinase [Derxia gummosa]